MKLIKFLKNRLFLYITLLGLYVIVIIFDMDILPTFILPVVLQEVYTYFGSYEKYVNNHDGGKKYVPPISSTDNIFVPRRSVVERKVYKDTIDNFHFDFGIIKKVFWYILAIVCVVAIVYVGYIVYLNYTNK